MSDTSSAAPANYDGDQTIYMYPTEVYEATFFRQSQDVILHVASTDGNPDHGLNYSVNGVYKDPWHGADPDGTHVALGPGMDLTFANVFPSSIAVAGTDGKGHSFGTVPQLMNQVSASFQKIYNIWDGLKLSWVGAAADKAQEIQAQLQHVQTRLFGMDVPKSDDEPSGYRPGVIGQMASAAAGAARVASNVEETNTKMFNDFADAVAWKPLDAETDDESGGSGSESTPPDRVNHVLGPVKETF